MIERQWITRFGVFSTQWTGQKRKRPLVRRKPSKRSIVYGNVKGSCIPSANENTLSVKSAYYIVADQSPKSLRKHNTEEGGRATWGGRRQRLLLYSNFLYWKQSSILPHNDLKSPSSPRNIINVLFPLGICLRSCPNRWKNWQQQCLDSDCIERVQKRSTIPCWFLVPKLITVLDGTKTNSSHLLKPISPV